MKLENKVIWITGASSGIGEALVHALAENNQLIISARRESVLQQIQAKYPENIKVLPLDLGDLDSLKSKADSAIKLFGKVDLLINNGGISQRSLAAKTDLSVDKKLMDVNYLGTIALTKALLPHFQEKKAGRIAVVTSLVGKFGTPYRSGYAASKHALHGFFDALRAEVYQDNIKITMVCPGFVKTNVSVNALTEDGSTLNEMDSAQANGMPADIFAKKMIRAIEKNKAEVNIGGKEVYGVYLKRFFPALFNKVVRRAKVR
ncbi:SDR family oxidoreductase [Fulvivirga lutea]|uniref:SDR family oxidoreductase n=1 Tax=Fulvivirga lutea TaxID=2810512 RepID=A0A974WIW5_9BACT|nr:SDR family oxidoreductase [Fulvivirga lutea]QSE99271.1 SDR family oxidoreductase [Fulvivirga lutea]